MSLPKSFVTESDKKLSDEFLSNGYVILPVEDIELLDLIREKVVLMIGNFLKIPKTELSKDILNNIADYMDVSQLNQLRLRVIRELNDYEWFRPAYFKFAKNALEVLVGNELAMQKKVSLSIQLPNDDSSLLKLHADTWSGDSPFEVVVWLPLVNCFETKSMYIMSPEGTKRLHENFMDFNGFTSEDLYQEIKLDSEFIKIDYGQVLLFNQCLPHGNRINQEIETRWSMNCRFKSIFTPYKDKKLGEFFEPITLKVASEIGMNYHLPYLRDE